MFANGIKVMKLNKQGSFWEVIKGSGRNLSNKNQWIDYHSQILTKQDNRTPKNQAIKKNQAMVNDFRQSKFLIPLKHASASTGGMWRNALCISR